MNNIKLFNIQHFSLYDGPGIRTVVFFKGCPLNCTWCHNPESKSVDSELAYYDKNCTFCRKCVAICPQNVHIIEDNQHHIKRDLCTACGKCVDVCDYSALEISGKNYFVSEILEEIKKDDMFFANGGGVTFSGGEPFMQFEGLKELARCCKEKNYSVCVETSGFTLKNNIREIVKYVDLFLYDYKLTNSDDHKKYVGAENNIIIENLGVLEEAGAKVILRCPVIPGINDNGEHFKGIASVADKYNCILHVELMPYHPLGISKSEHIGKECGFKETNFPDKKTVQLYADKIKLYTNKSVIVSG